MERKMEDIQRREPFSIDDQTLLSDKIELLHFSMIYEFLAEYASGNEEYKISDIISIARLAGASTRFDEDYNSIVWRPESTYFDVGVDGNYAWEKYISYGMHDISIDFNGVVSYMKVIHNQGMFYSEGSSITLNNLLIDSDGVFEVRAYDSNDNIIASSLIKYVTDNSANEQPTNNSVGSLPIKLIVS
jgi:hypothetical protein